MRNPRTPLYRFALVIVMAGLVSACSHDRYFFMERADYNQLSQQLHQQQSRLDTLTAVNQQQFDSLSRDQHFQRKELLDALKEQNKVISRLQLAPPPAPRIINSNPAPDAPGRYKGKLVVGEVEKFFLAVPGVVLDARIDSGATTSSLDATNIKRFERDGDNWVRFEIKHPESGEPVTLERKLIRDARIIQGNSEKADRRPVVELPFVIGDHRQSAEFTLNDRSHLTYPVLIGRNVLRDVMLIDVGREYVTTLPDSLTRPEDAGE